MTRRLILWDIDGTLVLVGAVGREAIEIGAAKAAGWALEKVPPVKMGGKTDPQIVREIFTLADLADEHIERLLPAALLAVEEALAVASERVVRDGVVLPGVASLLEALASIPGVRQTLVTGNVVANAALKTASFGLDRFLDVEVGAYGTDAEDRTKLVPICLERVSSLRGEQYAPDQVWVIGDTPHDLACARAGGVRCLLVGTGAGGFTALEGLGADAVVPDLSDTAGVLSILGLAP